MPISSFRILRLISMERFSHKGALEWLRNVRLLLLLAINSIAMILIRLFSYVTVIVEKYNSLPLPNKNTHSPMNAWYPLISISLRAVLVLFGVRSITPHTSLENTSFLSSLGSGLACKMMQPHNLVLSTLMAYVNKNSENQPQRMMNYCMIVFIYLI